jgi:hypothetical protein
MGSRASQGWERKHFFFEKKNQKTFARMSKSFLVLFFKKEHSSSPSFQTLFTQVYFAEPPAEEVNEGPGRRAARHRRH